MPLDTVVIVVGRKRSVRAIVQNNQCHVHEFLQGIGASRRDLADRTLATLAFLSNVDVIPSNDLRFKLLGHGIYEIRVSQVRILWFYHDRAVVCTHGFLKKSQKTPPNEIDRARRLMANLIS